MTVTNSGTGFAEQGEGGKDPLVSCLSRLMLEPEWVKPQHAPKSQPKGCNSDVISRAIVQETLLSALVSDESPLAPDFPSEFTS
jgi:hypothetical protein